MIKSMAFVTVPVREYDEALRWYVDVLGMELRSDRELGGGARWVTVGPREQQDLALALTVPGDAEPVTSPGCVGVLLTDDCRAEVERLRGQGVTVAGEVEELPWGLQAWFEDPYGNRYVLVQPAHQ